MGELAQFRAWVELVFPEDPEWGFLGPSYLIEKTDSWYIAALIAGGAPLAVLYLEYSLPP